MRPPHFLDKNTKYVILYKVEKRKNPNLEHNMVALCAVGAERAISNEIKKMGLTVVDSCFGRIRFQADTAGQYHALMGLRTADRVLLEAAVFFAADFDALFEGTRNVAWEELVPAHMGFKVDKVRSNRSRLRAETSIQSVVHKAAADRLCTAHGLTRLPEGGRAGAAKAAEVRVYVEKDMVSLLLDLSGEPLYKRGYRKEGGVAPLRETTAAAMLLLSGWKRKYPLYDPFCGCGTILIEALMYAGDMAPGLNRRFALNDLLVADSAIEETVRNELHGKINFERTIRIAGSDEDAGAVTIAKANIERFKDTSPTAPGMNNTMLELRALPMQEAHPCWGVDKESGFLVTNPPYGKRLGDRSDSERLYGDMAALERHFPHWKLAVITDHPGFESFFGKKADSCREIKGGPVPACFFQYDRL